MAGPVDRRAGRPADPRRPRDDRRPHRPDPGDLGQLPHRGVPARPRPQREEIVAFFKDPPPSQNTDFAHGLWAKTSVAKSNWHSSLEVRDAEGNTLSRFSLNVPKILGDPPDLEPSEDWAIVPHVLTFIGREKDFLVGYKDYADDGVRIGRVVLYVSLDPEMLPFLYSANPYFEVLRTDSLPSLGELDFGCEIFDLDGVSLFNPRKLTAGLASADLDRLRASVPPFWSRFRDRGTVYDAYLFRSGRALLQPLHAPEGLQDRGGRLPAVLLPRLGRDRRLRPPRRPRRRPGLGPQAALVVLQPGLRRFPRPDPGPPSPLHGLHPEPLRQPVHGAVRRGIGRPRELRPGPDGGLPVRPGRRALALPRAARGPGPVDQRDPVERRHPLPGRRPRRLEPAGVLRDRASCRTSSTARPTRPSVYDRKPFFVQRTRLGDYSFQTLTVPYEFRNSTLFISLPFPFEKEQLTEATREIVEFLVLLSAFFVALVVLFSRGIKSMIIVPVRKLLAGTREVGLGNLEVTIEHKLPGRDDDPHRRLQHDDPEPQGPRAGAGRDEQEGGLDRDGPQGRPRDQESPDAHPALGRARPQGLRGQARRPRHGPQGIDVLHHRRGREPPRTSPRSSWRSPGTRRSARSPSTSRRLIEETLRPYRRLL
ncbi:MAG: hypothetical protein M0C28_35750 [Candidatus Moduliflexus flocculans]|nr:hypothetical protein [Candidatus Moduliflexus flocculans]